MASGVLTGALPIPHSPTVNRYGNTLKNLTIPIALVVVPLCHRPFTVNAWPSIAEGIGARTSMSENELDILTRYFQYNAKILPRNSDPR
ncbi:hypothetical protein ACNKHV_11755 [Shigella flexneri]